MLVTSGGPVALTGIGQASVFLLLLQDPYQLRVVRRHPAPCHFEKSFALLVKLRLLHAIRLGAENPVFSLGVVDKYMGGVRMRSQDPVHSTAAGRTGLGKLLAYVVDQVVSPLVNL